MPDSPVPDEDGILAEAAPITAFWRELGLPGLVDVHTHFMPPNVLAKVWAFFDSGRAATGPAARAVSRATRRRVPGLEPEPVEQWDTDRDPQPPGCA